MDTIEQKAEQAILQDTTQIKIAGKIYNVAPPSLATLIMTSSEISRLPRTTMDAKNIMQESLAIAKDCTSIGRILAILILGAKEIKKETAHVSFFGFKLKRKKTKLEQLTDELLDNATPREIQNAIAKALQGMQIGDFFGLTTFLLEINMMKETKVEEKTTVSGPSQQE